MPTAMPINTHLGMRGTTDFTHASQRPFDWDSTITKMFLNADAPLTAFMNLLPSEKATDPRYIWYREDFPSQTGAITGITLASTGANATTMAEGSTYKIKMSAQHVGFFRPRLIVMLRDRDDPINGMLRGRVLNMLEDGDNSYILVNMLEGSTGTKAHTAGTVHTSFTRFSIIGDSNPEGGPPPRGIAYDPEEFYNYTQISKTAIELTRTAEQTTLRHESELVRQRANSLRDHAVKRERMFIYGARAKWVGDNGKAERTTGGLLWFLKNYAPKNMINFPDTVADGYWESTACDDKAWEILEGKNWLTGGFSFLNLCLARIHRYGSQNSRICFCGEGVIIALQELAKFNSTITLTPGTTNFGLDVVTWLSPFGKLHFKTHPLFKLDPVEQFSALIIDPGSLKRKVIAETFTKKKDHKDGGNDSLDGRFEEFITEDGFKITIPESCAYITGFGQNPPAAE